MLQQKDRINSEAVSSFQNQITEVSSRLDEKIVENSALKKEISDLTKELESPDFSRSQTEDITIESVEKQVDENDLELLSRIIYCEAGGEGENDQLAVGQVVLNRMNTYNMTLRETIYQRLDNGTWVFSPVASSAYSTKAYSSESEEVARKLLSGEVFSPVGSSLYFCTIGSYNTRGWHYQYVNSGKGEIVYKTATTVYIR